MTVPFTVRLLLHALANFPPMSPAESTYNVPTWFMLPFDCIEGLYLVGIAPVCHVYNLSASAALKSLT